MQCDKSTVGKSQSGQMTCSLDTIAAKSHSGPHHRHPFGADIFMQSHTRHDASRDARYKNLFVRAALPE